jgi:hypothetical protein
MIESPTDGPWIGVALDGTLFRYDEDKLITEIGAPIAPMVERVKIWLERGERVKIVTHRPTLFALAQSPESRVAASVHMVGVIHQALEAAGLPRLEVTNTIDHTTKQVWADWCRRVPFNSGAD